MAYVALYRKYRSQSFSELMGQEQVTVTLQNAIRSGRIAHAYLFYGARGCGKTSTARLLARAVNCVAQDGPTPEPCGTCRLCTSIRDGICLDVTEMDAASETGIDDVREKIIENVQYAPSEARCKVYIIDEVHDLSAKAFDALLKTLEEPPAHVIFILATTEYHKVPITIRSRCQQYHFKRGTLQDLARSVQRVCDLEGCPIVPEAVQAIARGAEGSWRDALSLLEQVLAYSNGTVTAETVHRAIGSVGADTLNRVTQTLATGDMSAALTLAGELIDSGKDVRQLLSALSSHLRDLMLVVVGANAAAEQELGPERVAQLQSQAPYYDAATLLQMASIVSGSEREARFVNQHRWLLESTLLRLMPVNLAAAAQVRERVSAPSPSAPAPRRETVASTPTFVPRPAAAPYTPESGPFTQEQPHAVPGSPIQPRSGGERPTAPAGASSEASAPVAATPEPGSGSRFATELSLEVIVRAWPGILSLFRKASPSGAPWLEKGEVVGFEADTIILAFGDAFARDRIQTNAKGKLRLEQVVNQGLKTGGVKIRCISREAAPAPQEGTATRSGTPASGAPDALPALSSGLPMDLEFETMATAVPSRSTAADAGLRTEDSIESAVVAAAVGSEAPGGAAQANSDSGFLAEALSLFGGSVVRTEPLVPPAS